MNNDLTYLTTLEEFAELFPKGLEPYGVVGNEMIYSNNDITNFMTNWMTNSPSTRPISKKINEGIEGRNIIIGYLDKSKWKFIGRKLFAVRATYVLGFYAKWTNNLCVVLDDSVGFFGKAVREVPPILTHELIHMAMNSNPDTTLKFTMKPILIPFYSTLLTMINPKLRTLPDKLIESCIIKIVNQAERDLPVNDESIIKVRLYWKELFTKANLTESEIFEALDDLFLLWQYVQGSRSNINQKKLYIMAKNYHAAYSKIGVQNILKLTTPGQEAVIPSEVLCMSQEFDPMPQMINAINSMKYKRANRVGFSLSA